MSKSTEKVWSSFLKQFHATESQFFRVRKVRETHRGALTAHVNLLQLRQVRESLVNVRIVHIVAQSSQLAQICQTVQIIPRDRICCKIMLLVKGCYEYYSKTY